MLTRTMQKKVTDRLDIEALAQAFYDDVWRFCFRRVGLNDAADAAQETFVTAHNKRHEFRHESEPRTWIFGIALNICRNMNRKAKREISVEFADYSASHDPSGQAIDILAIGKAMTDLSPEHREVIMLHELDEFTYAEIAGTLGIPEGTVKSRLHHAFAALRKALNPEEVQS